MGRETYDSYYVSMHELVVVCFFSLAAFAFFFLLSFLLYVVFLGYRYRYLMFLMILIFSKGNQKVWRTLPKIGNDIGNIADALRDMPSIFLFVFIWLPRRCVPREKEKPKKPKKLK